MEDIAWLIVVQGLSPVLVGFLEWVGFGKGGSGSPGLRDRLVNAKMVIE